MIALLLFLFIGLPIVTLLIGLILLILKKFNLAKKFLIASVILTIISIGYCSGGMGDIDTR